MSRDKLVLFALLPTLSLAVAACDEGSHPNNELEGDEPGLEQIDEDSAPFESEYAPFDPSTADADTRAVARAMVKLEAAGGQAIPPDAERLMVDVQARLAHALVVAKGAPYFMARSADAEKIEITYLGRGAISSSDNLALDDLRTSEAGSDFEIPERYRSGGSWMTGFHPATGSEIEVHIPDDLSELVGLEGESRGANRGTHIDGEPELRSRGIVGPNDTRVRKGAIDTRQSSATLRRIVDLETCTGALVGPRHIVTAAHCMYTASGWSPNLEIRVGRNGDGWWGDAVILDGGSGAGNTTSDADGNIYWVSSLWKSAKDATPPASPFAYDIGLIVTPNENLGGVTGWFGWAYSNASHDDMLNRGYPSCSSANGNEPPGGPNALPGTVCVNDHMYGDSNDCGTAGFSNSKKDSYGYSQFGYHSCDTSGGQSGSPLYRQNDTGDWVVRGVHKGGVRPGVDNSSDDVARQSFALITRARSNLISLYRSSYP